MTFIFMPCRSSPQIALHDIISYLKWLVSRKTKGPGGKIENSVKIASFTMGLETSILSLIISQFGLVFLDMM